MLAGAPWEGQHGAAALAVHFAPMLGFGYCDNCVLIINEVENPVVTNTDAPFRTGLESFTACRPRIYRQFFNDPHRLFQNRSGQFANRPRRVSSDLEAIGHCGLT